MIQHVLTNWAKEHISKCDLIFVIANKFASLIVQNLEYFLFISPLTFKTIKMCIYDREYYAVQ